MKLTARLALSQLKVNKRRTIWTLIGITLSSTMLMAIYGLGYGTGLEWIERITETSEFRMMYLAFISGIAGVMSVFVIAISVIVISNAFRVSASERMAQFGILKSTGATKLQIMKTVVYEGLFLTIIGIPIGVVIGILAQLVSVNMINHVIEPMLAVADVERGMLMTFIFSWGALFLAIGVSFFTVFLSAWLPAKKASDVAAINAIRGIGEIQITNKKVRGGGVVKKIFGIEGMLARTFLKRSKRNFRATVVAMSFSVAIFIVAGSFFSQMSHFATVQWGGVDANVGMSLRLQGRIEIDCEYADLNERWERWGFYWEDGVTGELHCFIPIEADKTMVTTADFQVLNSDISELLNEGDDLLGLGMGHGTYGTVIPASDLARDMPLVLEDWVRVFDEVEQDFSVQLIVVNETLAQEMAELAGVPVGSNILLNQTRHWLQDDRVIETEMLAFNYQTLDITVWDADLEAPVLSHQIELHGQITPDTMPAVFGSTGNWPTQLRILVPEANIYLMEWWITTDEAARVAEASDTFLTEFMACMEADLGVGFAQNDVYFVDIQAGWLTVLDLDLASTYTRNIVGLVMFFIFAFVGALILIGLTNVISTISENVKTRSKEFAVLQSVGMTGGGIGRMLNLESIFSSLRALLFGMPLGMLGSYTIYLVMSNMGVFDFSIPWLWMISAVLAVFITTWSTMRYAANRLKNQNIIETIRSGSGM